MTKHLLAGLSALALFTLAACGGNSTGGNPIAPPTPAPVAYQAQLVFKGPLAGAASSISTLSVGRSIQSMNQRGILAAPGATPVPIMVVSNIDAADGCGAAGCAGTNAQGFVQAIVSPQPSSAPVVVFSQTAPNAAIVATPSPGPSATPVPLPPGVTAEIGIGVSTATMVQSSGTATASVGAPVNQSPTTQVYEYMGIAADCEQRYSQTNSGPGWAWNGSVWVQVSDPTLADIYVTGSSCDGSFGIPGDSGTLHFPGGGTFVSSDTPFASVLASQWANSETSMPISALQIPNPDGSVNAELIAKTRSGAIFKVFPNVAGGSTGEKDYEGAIEVSGSSVDGF
ncbi:MAG: hypothetical protein HKL92_03070 [Candidatus Eremiobacteraeota bacterium]|nr:hypothetical protein [Candidatus Eremiobacteraeota bacterium]